MDRIGIGLSGLVKPWKGKNYCAPKLFGGARLLVVGESTHSGDPSEMHCSPPELLTRTVEKFLSGNRYRFHTMITTLLAGRDHAEDVPHLLRAEVWANLAFLNYIDPVAAEQAERCASGG